MKNKSIFFSLSVSWPLQNLVIPIYVAAIWKKLTWKLLRLPIFKRSQKSQEILKEFIWFWGYCQLQKFVSILNHVSSSKTWSLFTLKTTNFHSCLLVVYISAMIIDVFSHLSPHFKYMIFHIFIWNNQLCQITNPSVIYDVPVVVFVCRLANIWNSPSSLNNFGTAKVKTTSICCCKLTATKLYILHPHSKRFLFFWY